MRRHKHNKINGSRKPMSKISRRKPSNPNNLANTINQTTTPSTTEITIPILGCRGR
jgi:hypothetical protein